jgi:hypothetical protein
VLINALRQHLTLEADVDLPGPRNANGPRGWLPLALLDSGRLEAAYASGGFRSSDSVRETGRGRRVVVPRYCWLHA